MSSVEQLISDYSDSISKHRAWLKRFDKQRVKKWEDFFESSPEGAICEAATRKLLSEHEVKVEPYEDLSSGGPDFRCTKDNKLFYVEVTCISKDTATKKTGLSDVPPRTSRVQRFDLPTKKIFSAICNKASQCANLDKPCIVAICTLHFQAGAVCFSKPLNKKVAEQLLTGTTFITLKIDTQLGQAVGPLHETTDLHDSAFVRPVKCSPNKIEHARNPISAALLCYFGTNSFTAVGALHPNPNHPFDRALLPNIEFCKLAEGYQSGQLKVEWI